jgi:hypothetical protein
MKNSITQIKNSVESSANRMEQLEKGLWGTKGKTEELDDSEKDKE